MNSKAFLITPGEINYDNTTLVSLEVVGFLPLKNILLIKGISYKLGLVENICTNLGAIDIPNLNVLMLALLVFLKITNNF